LAIKFDVAESFDISDKKRKFLRRKKADKKAFFPCHLQKAKYFCEKFHTVH